MVSQRKLYCPSELNISILSKRASYFSRTLALRLNIEILPLFSYVQTDNVMPTELLKCMQCIRLWADQQTRITPSL